MRARRAIAATGPPPSGPWCSAPPDTNKSVRPINPANTPPTNARAWRVALMSLSSSMIWRAPRMRPVEPGSALARRASSASRPRLIQLAPRQLTTRCEPDVGQRANHRREVDRVLHHAMRNDRIARPTIAVAKHDDLVVHQLDPGARPRPSGPQIEPPTYRIVVQRLTRHFTQCKRNTKRRGTARVTHRRVCVLGRDRPPVRDGCQHPLRGQQGTLYLHVVCVLGIGDPGLRHCGRYSLGSGVNLRHASDFLGQEVPGDGRRDGEAALRLRIRWGGTGSEYQQVR